MTDTNLNGKTPDIAEENIQRLRQLFPDVFTEAKIDFEKLQQVLGNYIETSNERYNFTWNGKAKALRLAQTPSMGTLRPCKEESKDWDTTQNLYIEGDNLEVLKLLQKSYHGKVKMIYIDPPYNTGRDFVYPDNFTDSIGNYKAITGQMDAHGKNISSNSETSGRYHTDWLNMMYPRLRLARNLLKDNGAIFISIDDNEIDNLKKLCNEVYGEENFIAQFPWQSRQSIQNDTDISYSHEYVVAYAKNRRLENRRLKETNANTWFKLDSFVCLPLPLDKEKFENNDNDPRGLWKADPFDAPNVRPNLTYVIKNPSTGEEYLPPNGRCWRTEQSSYEKLLADNRIVFGKTGQSRPQLKVFYEEKKMFGSIDNTWWTGEKCGTSTQGTKEIMNMFDGKAPFDTPKPTKLLSKIISLVSLPCDGDIILDFFSGSATTAHATMLMNVLNGAEANRRFIMVQLPEPTDEKSEAHKEGYINICEIGKERIRRAGEKIREEKGLDVQNLDIGFKVLKLDSSNIRKWQPDYKNLETSLMEYIDNYVEGRTELDVVYEIMVKYGLDLTYPVDKFVIANKEVYSIGFGMLIICLANEITIDIAKGILEIVKELEPETTRIVFKDNGFKTDSNKTNIKEILKCGGIDEFITL
ncbi:MAG: site-specific DNA-methyltransferase [Clostridiales bacterium]|jgi:adenine-specific DNA-methyltransferase|nr:site-specific DNA-methyltransferase [Clostridiales bacterium]